MVILCSILHIQILYEMSTLSVIESSFEVWNDYQNAAHSRRRYLHSEIVPIFDAHENARMRMRIH